MNRLQKALIAGGCAVILALGTNSVMAQGQGGGGGGGGFGGGGGGRRGGGNFDPAQRRAAYLDGMKTELEITDDAEWTAIEPKVGKVYDLGQEQIARVFRGMMGGGRQRGGNADDNGGQQRRQRGGFGAEPSAAVTALQKAIDDKAPTAEIKAKLKIVQDEYKDTQAKLTAAREDLRLVLTPRQEAIATLRGLL